MINAIPFDEEILVRYLSDEASPQDLEIIESWITSTPEALDYIEKLKEIWQSSAKLQEIQHIDLAQNWEAIQSKLERQPVLKIHENKNSSISWVYKIAAVLVLTLGLSYFGIHYLDSQQTEITASTNAIKMVELPDGSKIWLNKTASLSWEKDFGSINRSVNLEGEAFFEVVKDPKKPFFVNVQNTTTRVLGTSFNVDGSEEMVEVSLISGKVDFSTNQEKVILLPGEKATSTPKGIKKTKLSNHNAIAWKTKTLTFQNSTLQEVIADMANYYETEFEFTNPEIKQCTLTGKFSDLSLDEMIQELSFLLDLKFQKGNNKILIDGNNCN